MMQQNKVSQYNQTENGDEGGQSRGRSQSATQGARCQETSKPQGTWQYIH